MSSGAFIEVLRAGLVESRHRVSAAMVDTRGELRAWLGDPELIAYLRSAAKPLQMIPLAADGVADAYDMTDSELAVCCASHSGQPEHVAAVRGLLERIGCSEDDLECGPHPPFHGPSAQALLREGREPGRIHNNCSGKHTGMLAWARHQGVATQGYRRPDHPVQMRIRREIAALTRTDSDQLEIAIDGCGVVTFAQPLNGMAAAFARLVHTADRDPNSPAGRIVGAMTGQPFYVGGSDRISTRLMERTGGRILAKYGAEAVICLGERGRGLGVAVKVEDGARRAVGPAAIEFLLQVGMLRPDEAEALAEEHFPSVVNTRDEIVGELRPRLQVEGGT